jgi:hypothetical protein
MGNILDILATFGPRCFWGVFVVGHTQNYDLRSGPRDMLFEEKQDFPRTNF